jgi:hypothetical protein
MAALLMQAAIVGMDLLETRQCLQSFGDLPEIALADRDHVEHVAIFGNVAQKALGRRKGITGTARAEQPADAHDFRFDWRYRLRGCRDLLTVQLLTLFV